MLKLRLISFFLQKYFYRTKVPCLIVATKTERRSVVQHYEQQPSDFCRTHQLPLPMQWLSADIGRPDAKVYTQLATMAVYP